MTDERHPDHDDLERVTDRYGETRIVCPRCQQAGKTLEAFDEIECRMAEPRNPDVDLGGRPR